MRTEYDDLRTSTTQNGQAIQAFADGKQIPLRDVKPGDTVFTIVRVAETYHKNPGNTAPAEPRPLGLVAVVKLSFPLAYYHEMQSYLTELPACDNNPGESCPQTPSIDIYPRGEDGGRLVPVQSAEDSVSHSVSGTVTKLDSNALVLQGRSGKEYTVMAPSGTFDTYNNSYAHNYTDIDAALHPGSTVMVNYLQPPHANPQVITADQIVMMSLQLEGLNPKGTVKPY